MSKEDHNKLVIRGVITFGMLALVSLPPDWKEWAAVSVNLFWLWRT